MAAPSYTYTLTNGSIANASYVMQNFNDILGGVTDGTEDLSCYSLTVVGGTSSSSSTTGAVIITGGLGVSGSIYAGGTGVFAGVLNAANTTESSSVGTGGLVSLGGLGVAKKSYFGDLIHLPNNTAVSWRNQANNADIALLLNTSNQLSFAGTAFLSSSSVLLAAAFPAMTGDVTSSAGSLATTLAATTNATLATLTRSAGVQITGTNTNDDASAGYKGEYISSTVSAAAVPATGVWGDITSISLTAGDWDLCGIAYYASAGKVTQYALGISANSGTSTTGLSAGSTLFYDTKVVDASSDATQQISRLRVRLSGSATYYFKNQLLYGSGTPNVSATFSARRVR